MTGYLATAETDIAATPAQVWEVLTDPKQLKQLWFGAEVETDWQVGSPITWSGEWEGKPYQDKGEILEIASGRLLRLTHFSPLTGQPDVPENYHTLTYELTGDDATHLKLTQDNNASEEEAKHSQGMWEMLVAKVKEAAEGQ
ncbi:SRPBCC domain-containing protein [Kribbella capetownensis]|uniref:SRPBCC domain-containing protein n=1 Tax=Kribbella capetownensis TaxID=1572659 RepID=A0A4R0IU39_9ACTN|nr:SRPBCC domain-containing protein [Kribbella capetownensis]TCC36657.1 SRPBCC domain-containing protein [Kribbella capetownensis]